MQFLGVSSLIRAAAFVALLTFAGDIVADSLADVRGNHCVSETSHSGSQHEKTPCSHCSCAVHMGAVVVSASVINIAGCFQRAIFPLTSEQSAPARLPAAIDHPPRLA